MGEVRQIKKNRLTWKTGKTKLAIPEMTRHDELVSLIEAAMPLRQELNDAKERQTAISGKIFDIVRDVFDFEDAGTLHVIVDGVLDCKIELKDTVTIEVEDAERLRTLLGDRFDDLVGENTTYKPERKLIDMACNADDPESDAIGKLLTVKRSKPAVTVTKL